MADNALEPWQEEIVARSMNDALCCISYLANLLYPDEPYAKAREARLRSEGGEIIARIEAAAMKRVAESRAELYSRAA